MYSNRLTYRKRHIPLGLIGRYVLRESFASALLVLAVLLAIFMSNQFAEILGDAAADDLPRGAVMTVVALTFWSYLTFIAPIALLLGVLISLARLSRDSERAALSACGCGPGTLLVPIGLLGLVAAAGVFWLAFYTTPGANLTIADIQYRARENMEVDAVAPGSFTSSESGNGVVYARDVEQDILRGVFIQQQVEGDMVVVLAERGERIVDADTGDMSLRLVNGRRYQGMPGNADYFVAEFEEHGIPIPARTERFDPGIESVDTVTLFGRRDAEARAEFQWRVAAPVSTLLLVLLAVPLSRSSPREGRYGRVMLGALLCIVYLNTLSMARVWVERDLVPSWLGMWWVHVLLGLLVAYLMAREFGTFSRPKPLEDNEARREPVA